MPRVLMLPGFGGRADQPILLQLEVAIGQLGISAVRAMLARGPALPRLAREVEAARSLSRADPEIVAYAGRSFGGRVLARLALDERPRALVLLGFPVRSQDGRRRREDETVLEQLPCPTLIVQGSADPLGPLQTFRRLAKSNPRLELEAIPGAAHQFGPGQRRAVSVAAEWLARQIQGEG